MTLEELGHILSNVNDNNKEKNVEKITIENEDNDIAIVIKYKEDYLISWKIYSNEPTANSPE